MEMVLKYQGTRRSVGTLTAGDAGVAETVACLQAMVDHALYVDRSTGDQLRKIAAALQPAGGARAFAGRLWQWAYRYVAFQEDPAGQEMNIHPADMLQELREKHAARGDCDDLATLLAAIITAAGFQPVLVTAGLEKGDRFRHIYAGIRVGPGLGLADIIPIDAQERTPVGQHPKIAHRVKVWALKPSAPK